MALGSKQGAQKAPAASTHQQPPGGGPERRECPLQTVSAITAAADAKHSQKTLSPSCQKMSAGPPERRGCPLQVVAAITASLSYAMVGVFTSWSSPVLPRLTRPDSPLPLTAEGASWVASAPLLTGSAAMLCVQFAFDAVGRRTLLLLAALPYAAGCAWQASAATAWELTCARAVASQGVATVVTVLPAYLAEVAGDARRGAALGAFQLLNTLGALGVLVAGPLLPYRALNWALLALPALFAATFCWMPESPYYLMMKGRRAQAELSLQRLRGRHDVSADLRQVEATLAQQRAEAAGSWLKAARRVLTSRAELRTLLIALGFTLLTVGTGISAVLTYASRVAASSSLGGDTGAAVLGAVQVVASAVSSATVDALGRRPLALLSFALCAFSQAAGGVFLYVQDVVRVDVSHLSWVPLAALIVYMGAFTMGISTLVWTVSAEMFSNAVKGVSMSLVALTFSVSMFAEAKFFQVVADSVGAYVAFWTFASCGVVGFWYVYFLIPETKGKSLLDINTELNDKLGA